MKREVLLSDIAPENLFGSNDVVKLDANGCKDCSYCCREMTDTIILDPRDIYELAKGLRPDADNISIAYLLTSGVASLSVFDGLTLPHLSSKENKEDSSCVFLNEKGRCTVHSFRPGFCRLFPLGRIYENGTFHYFIQSGECRKKERTEVRISEGLGIENLKKYEDFVLEWNEIQENIRAYLKKCNDEEAKNVNMSLLRLFYLTPYDGNRDFYEQFEERRAKLI